MTGRTASNGLSVTWRWLAIISITSIGGLVMFVSSTFVSWMTDMSSTLIELQTNQAIILDHVERLNGFADQGARFTAGDGRDLERRIDRLERTTGRRRHLAGGSP